jgi:hypothetical protein
MAAIDFPNSPATNDSFTSAGRTWLYNGTAWTLLTLTQTVIPSNSVTSSSIVNDSIVNADINSSAAIAYSKLALNNSVVNADINSSAAIAYSKLSLSNTVVDADINSSAAIAATKISGTAIVQSIVDAKGDLIAGSADNTVVRLGVGTDGFSLIAASAETSGMKWINVAEDDQVILGSQIFG